MKTIGKLMALLGAGLVAITGIYLLARLAGKHANLFESTGKNIDERLRETKSVLDTATAHVQGVYDQIKILNV